MSSKQYAYYPPGHPEVGATPGVDCSTGPLGQGVANAVGMALAERILAARFNRPGSMLADHYTYAFCGDGCMMEGIENEAASLAAMWKLGKLILIYDSNGITIEGDTHISLTEDIAKRHRALGWHVVRAGGAAEITRTRICGGGARSGLWRRIIANVIGVPVETVATEKGPAYGAALLAMTGCGEYSNVKEACEACVRVSGVTEPDADLTAAYDRLYAIYDGIYPAMKKIFADMRGV